MAQLESASSSVYYWRVWNHARGFSYYVIGIFYESLPWLMFYSCFGVPNWWSWLGAVKICQAIYWKLVMRNWQRRWTRCRRLRYVLLMERLSLVMYRRHPSGIAQKGLQLHVLLVAYNFIKRAIFAEELGYFPFTIRILNKRKLIRILQIFYIRQNIFLVFFNIILFFIFASSSWLEVGLVVPLLVILGVER